MSDHPKVEPHDFEPLLVGVIWRIADRAARDLPLFHPDHDECRHCLRPQRLHPVRDWAIARTA